MICSYFGMRKKKKTVYLTLFFFLLFRGEGERSVSSRWDKKKSVSSRATSGQKKRKRVITRGQKGQKKEACWDGKTNRVNHVFLIN